MELGTLVVGLGSIATGQWWATAGVVAGELDRQRKEAEARNQPMIPIDPKPNVPQAEAEQFVSYLYNKYLYREPDAGGFQYWVDVVMWKDTPENVEKNIKNSEEALIKRKARNKKIMIIIGIILLIMVGIFYYFKRKR